MLTVFWNSERVVLADFLEKETTVNSEHYIETLTALKRRIERIEIRNETLLRHNKCNNKRCNSTPGLFSAAASTV